MEVRYIEIKTSPAGNTPVAALVQQPRDFSELQEV